MGHHLTERGTFKSDKYATWCPEGFFALKLTDPIAQQCALLYAARTDDHELARDLRAAVQMLRGPRGGSSLLEITALTAGYYDLTVSDLRGVSRSRPTAHARQVAMYLCRHRTRESLKAIGRAFNRDHTSVRHAVEAVGHRLDHSPEIGREVDQLEAAIAGMYEVAAR